MEVEKPYPGSQEARDLGCTCPVLDNEFGSYEATGGMFYITKGCPVHSWPLEETSDTD